MDKTTDIIEYIQTQNGAIGRIRIIIDFEYLKHENNYFENIEKELTEVIQELKHKYDINNRDNNE